MTLITRTDETLPMRDTDPKCVVCGEPGAGVCAKCGAAYCVHHRGVEALPGEAPEEGEEGPVICWSCRLAANARVVLFWVVLGVIGLGALACYFSYWS